MWENWRKIIQHTTHKNPSLLSLMDILLLKWLVLLLDQRPPNMGHMAICRKHTRLELDAKWPSRFSRWPSLKYWQSGSKARKALHIFTQDVQENLLTADLSDVFLLYRLYIYICIYMKVHLLLGGKTILKETLNILGFYLRGDSRCRHSLSKCHINLWENHWQSQPALGNPNPMDILEIYEVWKYIYRTFGLPPSPVTVTNEGLYIGIPY